MADFVIDANVTLAWLFAEDEHRIWMPKDWAEADMVSSWLWRLEVTNAVLVKERRRQITQAQGTAGMEPRASGTQNPGKSCRSSEDTRVMTVWFAPAFRRMGSGWSR